MNRYITLALVLLLLMGTVGCGWTGLDDQIASWKEMVKEPIDQPPDDVIDELMREPDPEETVKIKVQLYFARQNGDGLAVEEREIPKVTGIARATMEELLKGPNTEDLKSALPAGTRLLDINITPEGTCIVDFSSHITEVSGSRAEALAVFSIVNTLSQFSTVNNVSFLVEGKKVDSIGGDISTAEPVTADYGLSE
ncbi:MAG: GerMN domain-containing protein [Syntrophomonadaceae bacterium]|nr:GerMN domain-containing protein [Syntrophomonadaceae bacterium]